LIVVATSSQPITGAFRDCAWITGNSEVGPGKFYKGRSQEKTLLRRPKFSLLAARLIEQDLFWLAAMGSVAGH
jgi:hypothetical protein